MRALLLAAAVAPAPVAAEPAPPPPPPLEQAVGDEDIVVTGESKPYRLSDRKLRAAIAAFDRNHARYAPAAALRFRVRIARGVSPAAVHLDLVDAAGVATPIPIAADRTITLPPLPTTRFDLIGSAALRVEADVRAPGTSEGDRRLGDLRLQCRAGLELLQIGAPTRALFDMAGGCASNRFAIYLGSRDALAAASVSDGGRTRPLEIAASRHAFRMPLGDKSMSDAARVRLSFDDR